MSTSYYRLREPITSVRVDDIGGHDRISVWIAHGLAGSLVVRKLETKVILRMFAQEAPSFYVYCDAGRKVRCIMIEEGLEDAECLVSESGELFNVGQVRASIPNLG
jgi:hypothetical protein